MVYSVSVKHTVQGTRQSSRRLTQWGSGTVWVGVHAAWIPGLRWASVLSNWGTLSTECLRWLLVFRTCLVLPSLFTSVHKNMVFLPMSDVSHSLTQVEHMWAPPVPPIFLSFPFFYFVLLFYFIFLLLIFIVFFLHYLLVSVYSPPPSNHHTVVHAHEQPKCPSVDEWIKQLWNIYTTEFYSSIKKEENFTLFIHYPLQWIWSTLC